jgi:hypothetical protein
MKKNLAVLFAVSVALTVSEPARAQTSGRYLSQIPADSPYVFTSLEPLPEAVMTRVFEGVDGFVKSLDKKVKEAQKDKNSPDDKLARAIWQELKGKLNRKGLRSLGFALQPDFALYGLGPLPVFRTQLADGKKLKAAVKRVFKKAGRTLPTKKWNGKEYYDYVDGELHVLFAIQDREAVAALAPVTAVEAMLPFVFATETVPNPMTDARALKDIATKYRFTPYFLGYANFDLVMKGVSGAQTGVTGKFWDLVTHGAGKHLPPACRKEVDLLIQHFPRVIVGYPQFDATAMVGTAVLEMDAQMSAALRDIAAEVPGFHPEALREARFALGAAVKVPEARKLGLRAATAVDVIGKACKVNDMVETAKEWREKLKEKLPQNVENSRGAYAVGIDFDISPSGGAPQNIHAYAAMQTKDPTSVLAELESLAQGQVKLKVPTDGKFHPITVALLDAFTDGVFLAVDQRNINLALGTRGKASAEKGRTARVMASPFFYLGYDLAYIMKKAGPLMKDNKEAEVFQQMGAMYKGPISFWLASTQNGLALSGRSSFVPSTP